MNGLDRIPEAVRTEIDSRLDKIAAEERIRILFACESGSRAWGFESTNSDYDVRFIYAHDESWYLSIDVERKPDVVERPINDELDLSGWDLRKALQLLRKSNPPLLEWLGSPIVYRATQPFTDELRLLSKPYYSPKACFHHYLSMAKGNIREYLNGDLVRRKKYLYVLRPLFAARWIERHSTMPPTEFDKLVDAVVDQQSLKQAIGELVEQKRAGEELDWGARIPALSDFIDTEMTRHVSGSMILTSARPDAEELNAFFRSSLSRFRPN